MFAKYKYNANTFIVKKSYQNLYLYPPSPISCQYKSGKPGEL